MMIRRKRDADSINRHLLVEAEQFGDLGGWTLDTEFIAQMGSPYLMAHGLGVPVADAVTTVRFPTPGPWRAWVRTMDWVARWKAPGAPGRFRLLVDGQPCPTVFGTEGADWHWQDGGVVEVPRHAATLTLRDLTGFNGRCDAIWFTRDLHADAPPDDWRADQTWRRSLLETPEADGGSFDLVVAGGGYAGMCAALTAARSGCRVALIHDRPAWGGNASSEIRVPLRGLLPETAGIKGRLGSVVAELQYDAQPGARRALPEDNANYLRVLEAEPNLTLLCNHCVHDVRMDGSALRGVKALDVRTGRSRNIAGKVFADCTGHATLGALAGADYVIGTQPGPDYRPDRAHPLMGMSNVWEWDWADTPRPFPETPWALSLKLDEIPARNLQSPWSWESGFYRHPIDDLEAIRDWNLRALFGIWQAMKQEPAGRYRNARITHLAGIGGPRESRRLLGDHVLHEDAMLNRVAFDDGLVPVSWYLDRHFPVPSIAAKFPMDPFLADAMHKPGTQLSDRPRHGDPWRGIPYRCLYSRNLDNLFMAGRNISTRYWALGAVRVMRTCGMMGEVVGHAAALCMQHDCPPRAVYQDHLALLRKRLHG